MDATKGSIISILNRYIQFTVPVYQRPYSWEISQCEKLWNDIVHMQKTNRIGHFVGSIVNIAEQAMPTGVQKFMIIDGQQRMTTLTLLLIALRDYGYENQEDTTINAHSINGVCIQNDYGSGEDKYKMLLTQKDKDILIKLIDRAPIDESKRSKLLDNYNFFVDKIKSKKIEPCAILEGIGKLQIVNITLDRAQDDPQLIFESLNSTGMDLSKSDLIRNYILMGLSPEQQDSIYNNYWFPMENLFDYSKQTWLMDKFFKHYLTFKYGKIPVESKIYEEFKNYYGDKSYEAILNVSKELYKCAKYYTNIYYSNSGDMELDCVFKDIKSLNMDVASPFLIKVYYDYDNEVISKKEFIEIFRLCENYVFRRAICEMPTNSLNKTFNLAVRNINNDNYINSVKAFFIMLDNYKRLPSNEEFVKELKIRDIYNMRIRNYILSKLENHNNKSPIIIENFTVEHIMPQNTNLNESWKNDLGKNYKDIQKQYIHTIGNLTLTAYNSEMSDKSFEDKLNMTGGFKESALRLNSYIVKQDKWNKDTIEERANKLCKLSEEIWEYPNLSECEMESFLLKNEEVYTLDSYEYLSEDNIALFNALDKRILNISSDVKREFKKLYIAYKVESNFVDIVPQKSKFKLNINMKYSDVIDPYDICIDITNKGSWGNGDIEVLYDNIEQLDKIMDIIKQSYEKQLDVD
ncbi:GmrSD restriction endonuclease domain-containing protein [Terrisporobacter petrolearius]|uniref:GmrSD restriction endonuclease domain-containing protein n=1 Tax=Terrisporobacter petrolearius TaxID=1460447 RepID=UPI003B0029B4